MRDRCYILPTWHGGMFIGGILVMILTGATYNNNLVNLLSFLLFSIMMVAMVMTNANIKKIQLTFVDAQDVPAGQPLEVTVRIINSSAYARRGVRVRAKSKQGLNSKKNAEVQEVVEKSSALVKILLVPQPRGIYSCPRFIVESVFPMGLFRAWKSFNFQEQLYVFPAPQGHLARVSNLNSPTKGESLGVQAEEAVDFYQHRKYAAGESQHRVDWKAYARTGRLLTKEFVGPVAKRYVFRLDEIAGAFIEPQLSQLARWIVDTEAEGVEYALIRRENSYKFDHGKAHLRDCLRELAKYSGSDAIK